MNKSAASDMPKVCTYDNPATMQRECWEDRTLICAYNYELFFLKEWPLPPKLFFFGANIGPWIEGQTVGDAEAIGE